MSAPYCVVVGDEDDYEEADVYGPFDRDEAEGFEAIYRRRVTTPSSRVFEVKPLLGLPHKPHAL